MRAPVLGLMAALATSSIIVRAEAQRADGSRWPAYFGCWRPGAPAQTAAGAPNDAPHPSISALNVGTSGGTLRCVVPGTTSARATFLTIVRGDIVDRQEVIADGAAHAVDRDGCRGTETANWTGGGARLVVRGELSCASGPTGATTAVLDVLSGGSWVQVSGLRAGANLTASAQWYRQEAADSSWPAEVRSALIGTTTSSYLARAAAASDPAEAEVTRVAASVDDAVAGAWLISRAEAGQRALPMDAATLVRMNRAGVRGEVTDVLVALANPSEFEFRNGAAPQPAPRAGGGDAHNRRVGFANFYNRGSCYAPWQASAWAFYNPMYGGLFPSAFDDCAYSPYGGYGQQWALGLNYGYPGAYGYGGGWFWRPIGTFTPVQRGPDTHTTLSRSGGYRPSGSSGSDRVAAGRGASTGTTANATGGSSTGSRGTPSGSSGGRTAVKKP